MKLIHHCYAIRNLIHKGPSSDDSPYSLRFIAQMLSVARARLIEQKADKYTYISEQSFQSLCITLEEGQYHNCCDGPTLNCTVLKSTIELPKFLNTRWGDFIKVTTLDGAVIPKVSMTQDRLSEFSLTRKPDSLGYLIHDNKLVILGSKFLKQVLVNSLFADPEQIEELNCNSSNSDTCPDFYDTEYPIDPDLIDPMYKLTLDLIYNSMRVPQDLENNAKAD